MTRDLPKDPLAELRAAFCYVPPAPRRAPRGRGFVSAWGWVYVGLASAIIFGCAIWGALV